jgi:GNAT superfamily N-acetyltransferase
MGVTVRAARPGDGDAIASAWQAAAEYYAGLDPSYSQSPGPEDLAELWNAEMAEGGDDTLQLVAELDRRVVGWLLARVMRPDGDAAGQDVDGHQRMLLMVAALVVDREYWRQGTGTALAEVAESWGAARGARVARLATDARSPVSVPFYEHRMGYQRQTIIFEKRLRPSDA